MNNLLAAPTTDMVTAKAISKAHAKISEVTYGVGRAVSGTDAKWSRERGDVTHLVKDGQGSLIEVSINDAARVSIHTRTFNPMAVRLAIMLRRLGVNAHPVTDR